jgi:hypothetical protein
MDQIRQLRMILRDLALWNNQYNEGKYFSVAIADGELKDGVYTVSANNEYWLNDDGIRPINYFTFIDTLISE